MKLILSFNKRQLRNAEHVQLHANVRAIVTNATATKLGITQQIVDSYDAAIEAEQDIVNKAAASIYTKEMEEQNVKRTRLFSRIRAKLALCALEDTSSIAYKARNVVEQNLLTKYPASAVNRLAYQEKTAVYNGFILDCRAFLTAEQLEGIGIEGDLDDLKTFNDKFNVSYQSRVAEKAAVESELSLKLRAITDDAYTVLALMLNAMANDPTEANATKAAACASTIDLINVVIDDTRKRLEARLNRSGESVENNDGKEEKPSSPSNPSNPSDSSTPSNPDIVEPGSPDDVME